MQGGEASRSAKISRTQSSSRLEACAVVLLVALGAGYLGMGLHALVVAPKKPGDLRLRWIEQWQIRAGAYPPELANGEVSRLEVGVIPPHLRREVMATRSVNLYPPWAYGLGSALVPPIRWPATRAYFGLVNAIALASAVWALWASLPSGRVVDRLLLVVALSASSGLLVCLRLGQYSLIVTAAVVGAMYCLERRRDATAGLLLGIGLLKPHLVAPFLLIPLIARRWRCLGAAGGVAVVGSALAFLRLGRVPIDSVSTTVMGVSEESGYYLKGILGLATSLGLGYAETLWLGLLGGGVLSLLIVRQLRSRSVWQQSGALAAVALTYTYCRRYDYVLAACAVAALVRLGSERLAGYWPAIGLAGVLSLPITEAMWTGWVPFLWQGAVWYATAMITYYGWGGRGSPPASEIAETLDFDSTARDGTSRAAW